MNLDEEEFLANSINEFAFKADPKFRAGAKEYGTKIWSHDNLKLVEHAKEEVIDQWMYLCALEKRLEAEASIREIDMEGYINTNLSENES